MSYHHLKRIRYQEIRFWRLLAYLFMATTLAAVGAMWSMSLRVEPSDLVYAVCNESRMSPSIKEHGCAALQDQLHLEFLCQQNNTDPDTHCWVEEE